MARMFPPNVLETTQSGAERRLFARIRDELPDEWIVLHSLGLAIHARKPWAEIDFVLIGPPGVFCLEVKGGDVSRVDGVWYTSPRGGSGAGKRNKLKEPPFDQVGSASAELYRYLIDRVPKVKDALSGYAVATPDCRWTASGPDIDRALVYDDSDGLGTFDLFMQRVASRWDERIGKGWKREPVLVKRADREKVLAELRGDFNLVPSLRATVDRSTAALLALTVEQGELFARLESNARVLARGGAGTGKTLLAVAEAQRLARAGKRVLLTCYSRNLANHLAELLADEPQVIVRTLHSLMHDLVRNAGRSHELPDAEEDDLFSLFYPELAAEILLDGAPQTFDALIVDEGQDLLSEAHLDVLDLSVAGGFAAGTWRWFIDPNQNIFKGTSIVGMQRLLAAAPVDWPLTVNCRNTEPVASQVALLSGVPLTESLMAEGPSVEYCWYVGHEDLQQQLAAKLRKALRSGIAPADIAVLSHHRIDRSGIGAGLAGGLPPIFDVSRGAISDAPIDAIRYSTIASFKGLESDLVFLIDVGDLASADALAGVYVGTSRAKAMLSVFLSAEVREQFMVRATEFGTAQIG